MPRRKRKRQGSRSPEAWNVETLAAAVAKVVSKIDDAPIKVGSLWVLDEKPLDAIVMPLAEGASKDATVDVEETAAYTCFRRGDRSEPLFRRWMDLGSTDDSQALTQPCLETGSVTIAAPFGVHPSSHDDFIDAIGYVPTGGDYDEVFCNAVVCAWTKADGPGDYRRAAELALARAKEREEAAKHIELDDEELEFEEMKQRARLTDPNYDSDDDLAMMGGGLPRRDRGKHVCVNCGETFTHKENHQYACVYYTQEHLGRFVVDRESEFWNSWKPWNPPPENEKTMKEYGNYGGYKWAVCGCRRGPDRYDECERVGCHRAAPPSSNHSSSESSSEPSESEEDD